MPTYEYVCDAGHETEERQSIEADALERCPEQGCEAPATRQISMGGGVVTGGAAGSGGGADCGPGASGFT